jgi:BCCIP
LLDGPEAETLDLIAMTEHICDRVSIGQVVASPLEPDQDPEQMAEFAKLTDEQFAKVAAKFNSQRDVFGFSTILSLTHQPKSGERPKFLNQIIDYVNSKAKKYCPKNKIEAFQTILKTKNVGLLLAERVVNLPVDIVPNLHTELPDDLEFTKA